MSRIDSNFETTNEFISKIKELTKKEIIIDISKIEDIEADIMVIAPCSR